MVHNDSFALPGEAKGELAVLKDAEKWSTNVGHPSARRTRRSGRSSPTFVLPNMTANAAGGKNPADEVANA